MRALALMAALALALPGSAGAQEIEFGTGAVLRGLEKVSGDVADITLQSGNRADFGRLTIELAQCRYPQGDPAADAYAYLTITEQGEETPRFAGWMIASSPALNALDHPRYDVWVMRCTTE